MEITLEEAANGKETQIRIPAYDACETCSGSGAKPGTSPKVCTTCNGAGTVHMRQGFFSIRDLSALPRQRKIIPGALPTLRRPKAHQAQQDARGQDSWRINEACASARAATASRARMVPSRRPLNRIRIKPHEIFERRRRSPLHVPVGLTNAALGRRDRGSDLGAKAEIELPKAAPHGKNPTARKASRASAQAIRATCTARQLETPIKLTEHQRNFERARRIVPQSGDRTSPTSKSWSDRVRSVQLEALTARRRSTLLRSAASARCVDIRAWRHTLTSGCDGGGLEPADPPPPSRPVDHYVCNWTAVAHALALAEMASPRGALFMIGFASDCRADHRLLALLALAPHDQAGDRIRGDLGRDRGVLHGRLRIVLDTT